MTQNSGQEHARTQLTSNDGTMKNLEDSVQGNKSTSDNPPWTTLGAKPKRRPDKGERITGRTQRPDSCDLRGTTKKPPQQTGVNLQNRFAPLLQDHGSPSKFLDNPPPPRSRVRPISSNNTKVLCFPEDMVSDLEERILEIVAEHPTVKNLILHIGSNDIEKQQSEKLKEHLDNLLETVSSVNAEVFISGPLPPTGRGAERFSRLFWLNKWLLTACAVRSMHCINNFSFFWDRRHLFKTNGLCLNKMGANSKSTPKPVNNTIRMALLNVRSLNNKSFLVNDFITTSKLDFMFLTETWLEQNNSANILIEAAPPNYNFIDVCRSGKRGGGVAAIFRNIFQGK
uniref:Endonuclease/exonuclease/phosphatase domain-containing protein n=1 Tax=Gasterosteus aculeatus aculeatus TaxID=481459 RepID=A0AAQ4R0Q9_GASAC